LKRAEESLFSGNNRSFRISEMLDSCFSGYYLGMLRTPLYPQRETETLMHKLVQQVARFMRNEDGPTAVEYAVMLALIIVVCIAAITTLGSNANATFTCVGNSLTTAS
jgi:pilus assembly protein Flp/PilA